MLLYLSSGLFLGWALGANQLGNIFGTAIGSKMISFRKAAFITSLFIILGAFFSGGGTAQTISSLGHVDSIAGAFTITLSAGFALFFMTKSGIPVSSTQAMVGSFIGWHLYNQTMLPSLVLSEIFVSWLLSPFIALVVSFLMMKLFRFILYKKPIPLLYMDAYLRVALLLAGIFASYAVGANNIANVMGAFITANPFHSIRLGSFYEITPVQQLFFLGALAMAVGVYTFSHKVVQTVGEDLLKITGLEAFVIVLAQGLVLFLFSSVGLKDFLISWNLPTFPLVPISNSEAIIGSLIGVSISKHAKGLKYKGIMKIAGSWVMSPVMAGVCCFILLFFMSNVFRLPI